MPDKGLHMGKNNRKKSKLSRFKPAGATGTLGAMVDNNGNITTQHSSMAELLNDHWSQVCTPRYDTKRWFQMAYPEGPPC